MFSQSGSRREKGRGGGKKGPRKFSHTSRAARGGEINIYGNLIKLIFSGRYGLGLRLELAGKLNENIFFAPNCCLKADKKKSPGFCGLGVTARLSEKIYCGHPAEGRIVRGKFSRNLCPFSGAGLKTLTLRLCRSRVIMGGAVCCRTTSKTGQSG